MELLVLIVAILGLIAMFVLGCVAFTIVGSVVWWALRWIFWAITRRFAELEPCPPMFSEISGRFLIASPFVVFILLTLHGLNSILTIAMETNFTLVGVATVLGIIVSIIGILKFLAGR